MDMAIDSLEQVTSMRLSIGVLSFCVLAALCGAYVCADEFQVVEPSRRYSGLLAGDEAYRMHEAQRWSDVARQAELNYGLSWLSRPPVLYPGAWYGAPWDYQSAWPEPAYMPGFYNPYAARYGFTDPPAAPPVIEDQLPPLDDPPPAEELPMPAEDVAENIAPREF